METKQLKEGDWIFLDEDEMLYKDECPWIIRKIDYVGFMIDRAIVNPHRHIDDIELGLYVEMDAISRKLTEEEKMLWILRI